MTLTEYIKTHKFRYIANSKEARDISSGKHGRAFIEAWGEMFILMPIPEKPRLYQDKD